MIKKVHLFRFCCLLFTFIFSSLLFAKEVDLYDAPKADAKVTGKIDLSAGVIPIYTPKEGDWIKVGDPHNGNVGWLKSSEMNSAGSPSTVTFTQRIINDGKSPHTYQFIQYGGEGQKLTSEQMQELKKLQLRQQAIQQSMQRAVDEMMMDMNNLYHQHFMNFSHFPIFMPIVVVPELKQKPVVSTTSTGTKPPASTTAKPAVQK